MRSYRGVAESTLRIYAPLVAEFATREGRHGEPYNAVAVRAFVLRRARGVSADRARSTVTAMRMFLSFLAATGRCSPTLVGAVPVFASWRLAKLPRYISASEVEKLLAWFDTSTAKGLRNRLIVLLMARLGLRTAEVAAVRAADIDWPRGRLFVTGKGRTEAALPLPQEVGDAILRYVADARPSTAGEYLFVRSVPPWRPLQPSSITDIFSVAMRSAGITGRFCGAHLLRHSLATKLLSKGASLEQIGTVLRHQSTATTEIYAKVDIGMLRRVTQPWPVGVTEAAPC
jgi:site-specific recombinase XerD